MLVLTQRTLYTVDRLVHSFCTQAIVNVNNLSTMAHIYGETIVLCAYEIHDRLCSSL